MNREQKKLLRQNFRLPLKNGPLFPQIELHQKSQDGTDKFVLKFADNKKVEAVVMHFHSHPTVCLSTQVGCAMNCSFCFTGKQGFSRNLLAQEIIDQFLIISQWLYQEYQIKNYPHIVFMGQGEPLANFDELTAALKVLTDPYQVGLGPRQITVSTVGYLPRLKDVSLWPQVNLALSLHSPFEEERTKLIPINQHYPLQEVLKTMDQLPLRKRQFLIWEYILIKNKNMSELHAKALAELSQNRPVMMNLIPFNPFPGSMDERPSEEEIQAFQKLLVKNKVRVLRRTTRGLDIMAACGQLITGIPRIKEQAYAH